LRLLSNDLITESLSDTFAELLLSESGVSTFSPETNVK
jgi:hypothetical protein